MELIDAFPLRQAEVTNPAKLYGQLMALILRFASVGLIHGDFNEFNILVIEETQTPMVIDFPQMISINHPNAEDQFNRDVQCIKTFFERKFRYTADDAGPFWTDVKRVGTLDVEVDASGISKKQAKELFKAMDEARAQRGDEGEGDDYDDDEEDSDDDDEEDDEEEQQEDETAHSGDEKEIPKK